MKASEYRRQFDAELEKSATRVGASARRGEAVPTSADVLAELTNRRFGAKRRIDAIERAGPQAVRQPELMNALIELVGDPDEDVEVRRAASSMVQALSFKTVEFRSYASDYHAALRAAATDENLDLRSAALDILSLNRDPYAQQLLLEGLKTPSKAQVKPIQAVRMLGYDVHAEHYPVLREIVEKSKQPTLRREALRLLAADSSSRELMQSILTDKQEDKNTRATAAVALQSLAPKEFAEAAQAIVLDDDETSDIRATVISAIAHGPSEPSQDLTRKVLEIDAAPGGARQLNRAARQFVEVRAVQ